MGLSELEARLMRWLLLLLSHFSRVQLCATPWTAAYQAPPSMGFSGHGGRAILWFRVRPGAGVRDRRFRA